MHLVDAYVSVPYQERIRPADVMLGIKLVQLTISKPSVSLARHRSGPVFGVHNLALRPSMPLLLRKSELEGGEALFPAATRILPSSSPLMKGRCAVSGKAA